MEVKSTTVIGVDIGGSHICAGKIDNSGVPSVLPSVLPSSLVRRTVRPDGEPGQIVDAWATAIESCAATIEPCTAAVRSTNTGLPHRDKWRIGIAMPGPFDYEKGICLISGLHKFESLYGRNIRELLAQRLGIAPGQIRMMNDAAAFLLGEMKAGAGRGYSRAAGVTLGTGLGSAHYLDHILYDGDLWCTPFRLSRAEDYLCSRWFLQMYEIAKTSQAASVNGRHTIAGVRELASLHDEDADVRAIFSTFGRHLAELLFLKYPPAVQDIVIIGGNISKACRLFLPAALDWCKEQGTAIDFRPAELGESAALIGAAALWDVKNIDQNKGDKCQIDSCL